MPLTPSLTRNAFDCLGATRRSAKCGGPGHLHGVKGRSAEYGSARESSESVGGLASNEHELVMDTMDELRLRLGRADQDGVTAWKQATAIARRVLNTRGAGVADEDALRLLREQMERVRTALTELADVEARLARELTGKRRRTVRPYTEASPCVVCRRADALVAVSICARCSGLGPYTGLRWSAMR